MFFTTTALSSIEFCDLVSYAVGFIDNIISIKTLFNLIFISMEELKYLSTQCILVIKKMTLAIHNCQEKLISYIYIEHFAI